MRSHLLFPIAVLLLLLHPTSAFFNLGHEKAAPVPMELHYVSDSAVAKYSAACLDGTKPALYYRQSPANSTGGSQRKWVIFFEGGGWCFTPEECLSRSKGGLGSSTGYPDSFDAGGMMSSDPQRNPDFHEWHQVFVKYCDGSSFSGARVAPLMVNNTLLHFRGRANLNAVFADLLATDGSYGLSDATDLLLTGGSAGALTAYLHAEYIQTLLPDSIEMSVSPDAGFFLDHKDIFGRHSYRAAFQAADLMWNATASRSVNLKCLDDRSGADQWQCLFAQYTVPYITSVRLFATNSLYDTYQLPAILGMTCFPPKCNATEMEWIQQYRLDMLATAKEIWSLSPANGAFLDSCFVHEQNVDYCSGQSLPNCRGFQKYTVPDKSADSRRYSLQEALGDWYYRRAPWDGLHVVLADTEVFPQNPTCPWGT